MTEAAAPTRYVPSRWTRRVQVLTAACSVVFCIGTALQNFAVVDPALIETMMRDAGGADPAGEAPGFTVVFRLVGCAYILGNALGILAFWSRAHWLFWVVLAVNATQGLGYFMIPPEMWSVAQDRYGVVGILPSLITDGGAAVLTLVLIAVLAAYRTTWAQHRAAKLAPAL